MKVGELHTFIGFLKGLFNMRTPRQSLTLSWDLSKVLARPHESPFDPLLDVPLKWVSFMAVFLVTVASESRSSDFTKLGYMTPYLKFKRNLTGIRFVPRGLRKQDWPGALL